MKPEFGALRQLIKRKLTAIHSHQSPCGMPNPLVLSGTYYVKIPANSGQFVIEDFHRPLRYLVLPFQEPNHMNPYTVRVQPRDGDLLLFPAWLGNGVEINSSNEDQISIAFNVALLRNKGMQKPMGAN
ncbi:MAG TPA: hypothetical protein EYN67_07945 [Flavobacteriales bacterium]|jgi:uncharacterized protein (TIGR02466 family)|nr:hypothetical protein [Flavobacteriales bacterium]